MGETMSRKKHRIIYNSYEIEATPKELPNMTWSVDVTIYKKILSTTTSEHYTDGNIFKTETEAITGGLKFGKDIIDGKKPDLSAP